MNTAPAVREIGSRPTIQPTDFAQPRHREPVPQNTQDDQQITSLLKELVVLQTNTRMITTNFYTISYGDMMQVANELKDKAPNDSMSAEVIAAWLYAWAKAKVETPITAARTEGSKAPV